MDIKHFKTILIEYIPYFKRYKNIIFKGWKEIINPIYNQNIVIFYIILHLNTFLKF